MYKRQVDDLPIYNSYIEEFGFDGLQKTELSADETAKFSTALDAYLSLIHILDWIIACNQEQGKGKHTQQID